MPLYSKYEDDDDDEDEGNAAIKEITRTDGMPKIISLVLMLELCERISYYSVSANLLLFCQAELKFSSSTSAVVVLLFTGVSYILPLFGSWIADGLSGKFNAIYCSSLCYLVGTCLMPLIAYNGNMYTLTLNEKYYFFTLALIFISIGTGGIKANISTFGAEQVSALGEAALRRFFNWFYWLINLASLVSFTFIAYLQTKNFFYGYIPPVAAMFLATFIFVFGRKRFICKPANGSQLTDVVKIFFYAIARKVKYRKRVKSELPVGADLDLLDFAHISFGGKYSSDQIDIVRCVGRITLVFMTMIIFWAVYFQMISSFLLQGEYMKLHLYGSFNLPAASLNVVDVIVILCLIQLMEFCIYPACNHFRFNFTPLRRMGVGMVLASLSMVSAGLVETYRRHHVDGQTFNNITTKLYNASSVTVFLQVPQYLLIGSSEVFTSISALEFAYLQSPKFLQGVVMGLFLCTSGLGAMVGCILVTIFDTYSNWYCDDINSCQLEYYFYSLAILVFVNFLLYLLISTKYSYVKHYSFGGSPKLEGSQDSLFEHSQEPRWKRRSPALSGGHI